MIKLNRITEYALIALKHLGEQQPHPASAREIAERFHLPVELTAKTLQKLRDQGLLLSTKGVKGGYHLAVPLQSVSLMQVLQALGEFQPLVPCYRPSTSSSDVNPEPTCELDQDCSLKQVLHHLNKKMIDFLGHVDLQSLLITAFIRPSVVPVLPVLQTTGTFPVPSPLPPRLSIEGAC